MPSGVYPHIHVPWNKGKRGVYSEAVLAKMRNRKHTPETLEKMRKNRPDRSGKNSPMFGKVVSKEIREKISASLIGRERKPLSREAKANMSRAKSGENHPMFGKRGPLCPNWKGGISSLAVLIRGCLKYDIWRLGVFTRDDFTCVICHKRGGDLEADHYSKLFSTVLKENNIKTLEEALLCGELWNINGGRTLCKDCHDDQPHHRIKHKSDTDGIRKAAKIIENLSQ